MGDIGLATSPTDAIGKHQDVYSELKMILSVCEWPFYLALCLFDWRV